MCVSTGILSIRNLYFLILSENTWYEGGALTSLRFEMSAMILSGSLAKDRDLSFGVYCSKIFLSTVWLEEKKAQYIFFKLQKDSNIQGWSHWNILPVGIMSCEVGSDTTAQLFCHHSCCHSVSSAADIIMYATIKK